MAQRAADGRQGEATLPPELFTISGNPYSGNLRFQGSPLRPDQLFQVLDLTWSGLEKVKAAVEAGDFRQAAAFLLEYYRKRRLPPWPPPYTVEAVYSPREKAPEGKRVQALRVSPEDFRVADNTLHHIFQPNPGYPPKDYGPDIDWDWDPYGDIQWSSGMHEMFCWDVPVTHCYGVTGDERYARLWVDLVTDWIRKDPLTAKRLRFPESWDAIEVGIRLKSWSSLLPYYLDSPACTPSFLVTLLTSLYNHARRVMLMPYPRNDNFVIVENSGLASVALVFPEFREASVWREAAFSRLAAAVQKQNLPDGVQGELTPAYHLWCIDLHLDAAELALAAGSHPPFLKEVEKMCDVLWAISAPDGKLFRVGDSDRDDIRPTVSRAARIFGRSDLLARATDGREGRWPMRTNFAFPDGGFYSFRSDWTDQAIWLGLRCGPESIEKPVAFHAQFDNGTFELMAFGRLLMRDPGYFNYKAGDAMRELFRRTAAHQTLTLDGRNSARAGKTLQWKEEDGWGNAWVVVENAGYPNLTHRRTVFFVARKYFVLLDEALGTAQGEFDLHFQLTPGPVFIDPAAKVARTAFVEGGNVLVWVDPEAPVNLQTEEAWFSPRYNEIEPLPAFHYRHVRRRAPVRFLTVLVPFKSGNVPEIKAQVTEGEIGADQVKIRLEVNGQVFFLTRTIKNPPVPGG